MGVYAHRVRASVRASAKVEENENSNVENRANVGASANTLANECEKGRYYAGMRE